MAKKNPLSDDAQLNANMPDDLGGLNPSSDDAQTDLGSLNTPADETVDLGKLPPLAKFKKFQKKGK